MRLFAAAALILFAGVTLAAEHVGRLKSISEDGKTITITADDKDMTFSVRQKDGKPDVEVNVPAGGKGGKGKFLTSLEELRTAKGGGKKGRNVRLTTTGEEI